MEAILHSPLAWVIGAVVAYLVYQNQKAKESKKEACDSYVPMPNIEIEHLKAQVRQLRDERRENAVSQVVKEDFDPEDLDSEIEDVDRATKTAQATLAKLAILTQKNEALAQVLKPPTKEAVK